MMCGKCIAGRSSSCRPFVNPEINCISSLTISFCFPSPSRIGCNHRWASSEWAASKQEFLESLGHRALRDLGLKSAVQSGSAMTPSGMGGLSSPSPLSPYSRSHFPNLDSASGGAFPIGRTGASSTSAQISAVTMGAGAGADMSPLLKKQSAVVRSMNQEVAEITKKRMGGMSVGSFPRPCAELARAIDIPQDNIIVNQHGLSRLDLLGYQSILEMLSEMAGEGASPRPPGYFSTICFDPEDVAPSDLADKRRQLTSHASTYLQDQIWNDLSCAVDAAVREGQLTLPPCGPEGSRAQRVRAYVALLLVDGAIAVRNQAFNGRLNNSFDVPVYAYVYYCLRIGMLSTACDEVNSCVQQGMKAFEAVAGCLNAWMALAQSYQSQSQAPLSANVLADLQNGMAACGAMFEEERRKGRECDPYRVHVLNLLSLRDHATLSEADLPGASLEDFLWGNLWFIRWSQALSTSQSGGGGRFGGRVGAEYSETSLHDRVVLEYGGADHFGAGLAGPFNYARVLCCCHRFGEAIAHLWHAGKTLPAAHLTVVCVHYGLILPHMPLAHNPRRAQTAESSGVITPAALLQAAFQAFLPVSVYPKEGVDYLATLGLHWYDHVKGRDAALLETHKVLYA